MKLKIAVLSLFLAFGTVGLFNTPMNASSVTAPAATPSRTPTKPDPGRGCPPGATARCRDGSCSFSQNRRGTCSGHGGVAQWL
jgi:hypothetical protein